MISSQAKVMANEGELNMGFEPRLECDGNF
jgi:hypothetical protein